MNCCIKRDFYEELKEKPRIPRPPNAFMLYANENRKRMSQMFPTESNKDISKRLGNGWKNLDEDERKTFFDKAKAIGLQHKKEFPDYVYNPKEARIRKAMRDATRERSIGASPMLPRPSARRAPHSWSHEDLMMSPLGGMRSPMDCGFPFASGVGGGGGGGNGGAGYGGKLEAPPPPPSTSSSVVHTNYIQSNPLAQLQQHTEMWPDYQNLRPRSSGNPFMMPEVSPYHQQQQQQQHQQSPEPMAGMMQMERNSLHHHQMGVGNSLVSPGNSSREQQRHHHGHHQLHGSPPLNEHAPSPEASCSPGEHNIAAAASSVIMGVVDPEKMQQQQSDVCGEFDSKLVMESNSQQAMDSNQQHHQHSQEQFLPVFEQNEVNDATAARHAGIFEKLEDVKMKKPAVPQNRNNNNRQSQKKPSSKPLPDFNEAFGSTERGRFQSPPDPRLAPNNKGFMMDYFFDSSPIKFDDYQI